jgi:hypothetical protein
MASGDCPADLLFTFSCFVCMLIWQRILRFRVIRVDDMHIESYQFGKIVVDGVSYSSDVVILGNAVQDNWRRIHGHVLSAGGPGIRD